MTDRLTVDQITSDQLDTLYDERDRLQITNRALNTATVETMERAETAETALARVIELHEQWVKAGPPPLGTFMSRWWDRRLAELHNAITEPAPSPAATGHVYLSTSCHHGEQILPDGRTGHQYCQADTGNATKIPAQCKFCAAPCTCACHTPNPAATQTTEPYPPIGYTGDQPKEQH